MNLYLLEGKCSVHEGMTKIYIQETQKMQAFFPNLPSKLNIFLQMQPISDLFALGKQLAILSGDCLAHNCSYRIDTYPHCDGDGAQQQRANAFVQQPFQTQPDAVNDQTHHRCRQCRPEKIFQQLGLLRHQIVDADQIQHRDTQQTDH